MAEPVTVDEQRMAVPRDVAARISRLSLRKVDYWAQTRLVEPTVDTRGSTGRVRLYGFLDLLALVVDAELNARGVSVRHIRQVVGHLTSRGCSRRGSGAGTGGHGPSHCSQEDTASEGPEPGLLGADPSGPAGTAAARSGGTRIGTVGVDPRARRGIPRRSASGTDHHHRCRGARSASASRVRLSPRRQRHRPAAHRLARELRLRCDR
jgi:DNA-binding transcriptional MerR regulator